MATGFMVQIINKSASTLTFSSSNYQNTGDISPFTVTVPPGESAPGAPQNPGYYYFEQESVTALACFDVTITAPGEASSATLPVEMGIVPIVTLSSVAPTAVQTTSAILAVGGSSVGIGVMATGTTGSHNWTVCTIEAG